MFAFGYSFNFLSRGLSSRFIPPGLRFVSRLGFPLADIPNLSGEYINLIDHSCQLMWINVLIIALMYKFVHSFLELARDLKGEKMVMGLLVLVLAARGRRVGSPIADLRFRQKIGK